MSVNQRPELHPQTVKVRTDCSGMSISAVQTAIEQEFRPEHPLENRRSYSLDKEVNAFRVQVAAESLKLRGQQNRIRVVDLFGCIAPATRRAADAPMRRLDIIEFSGPSSVPLLPRNRRHLCPVPGGRTWP